MHCSGRWTERLTTLDPSMGSQHSHWQGCRGMKGCQGVGALGPSGSVRGFGVHWGGRWTGRLTTLDPSMGSQHSHWQGCRGMRWCQGVKGHEGAIRACKWFWGALGWQVDWEADHIGPQYGVTALPLAEV